MWLFRLWDGGKLGRQAGDDAVPVAQRRLPEQPGAGVPRAVVAADQPAPVTRKWQQYPQRLAQCARQMRDRGINRDHQIELLDIAAAVSAKSVKVSSIRNSRGKFSSIVRSVSRMSRCRL